MLLRLPIDRRRVILEAQAAEMHNHYQHDTEWREFTEGDIVDYGETEPQAR